MSDEITKRYMTTVYSALFGPYDDPPPALYGGVLFTDQDIQPDGWTVKRVERPHPDPRYASRYYFDRSTFVLPDAEYTVMHGANAQLQTLPGELVKLLGDADIACFAHPHRTSVYEEAEACIQWGKDRGRIVRRQMDRYRAEGFPEGVQLSACILLVRRNTARLREFEASWWAEVKNGSCRDQLSFDYVRWLMGMPLSYIEGNPFRRGDVIKFRKHR